MRAWKAVAWSLSGQAFQLVVMFVTLAVLGRLLTPAEFGVFGLVLAVQGLVLPILDMGLLPAYLKLAEDKQEASDAFFTINVVTGVVAAILLSAASSWAAKFYGNESLRPLLAVFALSIPLSAMSGQPLAVLSRNKKFKRIMLINAFVTFLGASLAILLAWLGYGVWALVGRALSDSLLRFALLAAFSGRRYRLVGPMAIKGFVSDIRFGMEIMFSRLLVGWGGAIDKLVLGKFVPMSQLGGYARSQQLAYMPEMNIRMALTTPALAYLARIEGKGLDHYMLLIWGVFALAGIPCFVLATFGDTLLPVLMGNQWKEFGWMAQWLGLFGLGAVFQGCAIIYHIDRKVVIRTNRYMLGAMVCVLLVPMLLLVAGGSLKAFVASISVLAISYWSWALFHTLVKDYPDEKSRLITASLELVLVAAVSIVAMLYLKSMVGTIIGMILQVTVSAMMILLLNRGMFWPLLPAMARERIRQG